MNLIFTNPKWFLLNLLFENQNIQKYDKITMYLYKKAKHLVRENTKTV